MVRTPDTGVANEAGIPSGILYRHVVVPIGHLALFFATVLVALPPPHTRHSTGFQHAEPNYRPGQNIPPSKERRRTAQRDEVSNP